MDSCWDKDDVTFGSASGLSKKEISVSQHVTGGVYISSCQFIFVHVLSLLYCALTAAQCIVIGPVCLCVCGCVGGSVSTINRNCVH